jgi:hypothetical protein
MWIWHSKSYNVRFNDSQWNLSDSFLENQLQMFWNYKTRWPVRVWLKMSLTAEIDCVEIFARLSIIITINLQKCQLPAVALISSAREGERGVALLVLLHDGRNNCVLRVSKQIIGSTESLSNYCRCTFHDINGTWFRVTIERRRI